MERSPLLQLGLGTVTFVQVDLTCFCGDSTKGTGGLSCFCSDSAGSFNSFNILSLSCSTNQIEDSRIHLKQKCKATRMERFPLLHVRKLSLFISIFLIDLTCFCCDSTEGIGGLSCFCSDSAGSFNSFSSG
ncbi:hypothetical protein ACOSP7_020273 [Xanthoceras sorbifolium]